MALILSSHSYSPSTGREAPCVLIYIPDGATKERPTAGSKFKVSEAGDSKQKQQKKGEASVQKVSAFVVKL